MNLLQTRVQRDSCYTAASVSAFFLLRYQMSLTRNRITQDFHLLKIYFHFSQLQVISSKSWWYNCWYGPSERCHLKPVICRFVSDFSTEPPTPRIRWRFVWATAPPLHDVADDAGRVQLSGYPGNQLRYLASARPWDRVLPQELAPHSQTSWSLRERSLCFYRLLLN